MVKRRAGRRKQHEIPLLRARGGSKHCLAEIVDFPNREGFRGVQRRFCHGIIYLFRREAGEEQRFDVAADLIAERIKRDVLVIPARDKDGLLPQRVKPSDRAGRAGCDGVVTVGETGK